MSTLNAENQLNASGLDFSCFSSSDVGYENSPGQRPEGVQDPQDGYVATVTCIQLLLHVYLCRGGPPQISSRALLRSLATRVCGVGLFPNSFGLIPELVDLNRPATK